MLGMFQVETFLQCKAQNKFERHSKKKMISDGIKVKSLQKNLFWTYAKILLFHHISFKATCYILRFVVHNSIYIYSDTWTPTGNAYYFSIIAHFIDDICWRNFLHGLRTPITKWSFFLFFYSPWRSSLGKKTSNPLTACTFCRISFYQQHLIKNPEINNSH